MLTRKALLLVLISVFLAGFALGGEVIPNWSAPATWSPAKSRGGLTTMGDVTNPLPFIGLAPCRIVDTRGNGAPIQGGMYLASQLRNYAVAGICGIPTAARALSLNITVTGPGQTGAGFLLAFPTGGVAPPVSSLNWDHAPATVGNAAVVPTNASVSFAINVSGPTHVVIDINGYYASTPATSSSLFKIVGSGPYAIWGDNTSAASLATGVYGVNEAATGVTLGVWGRTNSSTFGAAGTFGDAVSTSGVTFGVAGLTGSNTDGAAGVHGEAFPTTGATYGVAGYTRSHDNSSAGVIGVDGSGDPNVISFFSAGVRGVSTSGYGVLGISGSDGVRGILLDSVGVPVSSGYLGFSVTDGVHAQGNVSATGTKPFIEPHPTDAAKEIAYVALEGPEAGTYFRGRGRIQNGMGVIAVPESFRLVSDQDGLTVQITPIGLVVNVAVLSADLNTIVVHSSVKELEFYYLVNGVRKAFKDWDPITENRHYRPEGPTARMPLAFAPEQRRALIATGIYNADGTVNMATAERLGWAKLWRDREEQAKAAAAANAAVHAARLAETK